MSGSPGVSGAPVDYDDLYREPEVGIRLSTPEERKAKAPPIVARGPRIRVPKYVLFLVARPDTYVTVFGLPMGGDTQAETIFWAERTAGKNGLRLVRPTGWERVVGALPPEKP